VIDSVGNALSRIFGIPYDPTPPGAAAVVSAYVDPQDPLPCPALLMPVFLRGAVRAA